MEEGHVDPINNTVGATVNFTKQLVYSGEEKVLKVSDRVLNANFDLGFQGELDM